MIKEFKKIVCFGVLVLFFAPIFANAEEIVPEKFNIDPTYNQNGNQQYQTSALLRNSFNRLDFYIEESFLNGKSWTEKNEINNIFFNLNAEFEGKIYPQLTSIFGKEKNTTGKEIQRITILFYPMKEDVRGYIRNIDAYDKGINSSSNQRRIIYLNSSYINNPILTEILAHEFTHLIELNQKEIQKGIPEDVWLNEARAEYAVTLLGYNNKDDSYLDKRVKDFLNKPTDPLIEWSGTNYDYGVVSMFVHYMVEQYGIDILKDTLASSKIGIESIDEFLKNKGHKETFADIYTNWSIATYLNDCSVDGKYCYSNQKLKDVKVLPLSTFMPFQKDSTVSMNQLIRDWSSNWQKFVGGNGNLKLQIKSPEDCVFKVSYIVKGESEKSVVKKLDFKEAETKEVVVSNLNNSSQIVFIFSITGTSLQSANPFFVYNTIASSTGDNPTESEINLPFAIEKPLNQMSREELLIVLLKVIVYLISQGRFNV